MYWKTFFKRCIYQSEDLHVYDNFIYRWLEFDNLAIQTLINKANPQKISLKYIEALILAVKIRPGDCCMLGLGGGGAVHALEPLLSNFQLDVIEKNKEVIDVAKEFFKLNETKAKLIHDDAKEYLKKEGEQFNHLLVDLYANNTFPKECNNQQFFINCKKRLKPQGVLAVNLATEEDRWPILELIRNLFPKTTLSILVENNRNFIIFAVNDESLASFLPQLETKVKSLNWDSKWGIIAKI
ncbi:MAG: fused MFS/spermidine synthase [Proteobacteria bacterium]|nr:fused MFS/spermidine synthase [Pseudomonadota bacterium]